jgi:hypothetical protein
MNDSPAEYRDRLDLRVIMPELDRKRAERRGGKARAVKPSTSLSHALPMRNANVPKRMPIQHQDQKSFASFLQKRRPYPSS